MFFLTETLRVVGTGSASQSVVDLLESQILHALIYPGLAATATVVQIFLQGTRCFRLYGAVGGSADLEAAWARRGERVVDVTCVRAAGRPGRRRDSGGPATGHHCRLIFSEEASSSPSSYGKASGLTSLGSPPSQPWPASSMASACDSSVLAATRRGEPRPQRRTAGRALCRVSCPAVCGGGADRAVLCGPLAESRGVPAAEGCLRWRGGLEEGQGGAAQDTEEEKIHPRNSSTQLTEPRTPSRQEPRLGGGPGRGPAPGVTAASPGLVASAQVVRDAGARVAEKLPPPDRTLLLWLIALLWDSVPNDQIFHFFQEK